jgi:sRNA-binding carbon storage regulator CsrA
MLLLMRREGEAIRINEKVTVEVRQISEEEVVFEVQGLSKDNATLLNTEDVKK